MSFGQFPLKNSNSPIPGILGVWQVPFVRYVYLVMMGIEMSDTYKKIEEEVKEEEIVRVIVALYW